MRGKGKKEGRPEKDQNMVPRIPGHDSVSMFKSIFKVIVHARRGASIQ